MKKDIQKKELKNIVITGNPNVGKSVIFNYLTGRYVDVSNYSGTTMNVFCGISDPYVLSDTPGIYGLSNLGEEERIARDIILPSDGVICVVNALHLEQDLFLTQQLIDCGIPMVIALNMVDEAEKKGIHIKIEKLEAILGVPIVATVAIANQKLTKLKLKIAHSKQGKSMLGLKEIIAPYLQKGISQREAVLIAEGDIELAAQYNLPKGKKRDELYHMRGKKVRKIASQVVREVSIKEPLSEKISRFILNPWTGIPLLILSLILIYQLIGVFIAQTVVGYTEGVLFNQYYEPFVRKLLHLFISDKSFLWSLLAGRFGIFTMSVTYLIGLLLPLVFGFQFVLSFLEDSGYLPRIATMLDRVLIGMGMNGQAVIPLILGFGCVTMATMSTRMLGSDREKLIAIFLLALAVPCSAQMAIITGMIAGLGPYYALAYGLIIFTTIVGAGTILAKILPGKSTSLWLEIPPLRVPRFSNVIKKTWLKSSEFIIEAAPLFVGSAMVLSVMDVTGTLMKIENMLVPLTVHWLGLPKEVAGGFIMACIRREFGTAGLFTVAMSDVQKFIALTTITFFVPCIATTMVIFKERGWKQGSLLWVIIFVLAFILGGAISKLIYFLERLPNVSPMPVLSGITLLILVVIVGLSWRSSGEKN